MNRPQEALRWPWPADTPLDRARRLLQSYRAALADVAPNAVTSLDLWALEHGQGWVIGQRWEVDEDELLTLDEVADLAQVQLATVYRWHQRGLEYTRTVDGLRVRVGDLLRWERERRQRRIQAEARRIP